MFRGRYEYSIDTKGRLNIPAKVRELLVQEYTPSLMVTN
ncbi:MAG: cell division/cell wall cluster transcriptional repressor MraZ, partial [Deltaproteobacteria bacterium]|nr:cell division/cell wall cluster transcriptional repressor MraZ [Deltaproteobacteria bacterium]